VGLVRIAHSPLLELMPFPTTPLARGPGCPGCSSGSSCKGKPGEDLYLDEYAPDEKAYCDSCWAEEPGGSAEKECLGLSLDSQALEVAGAGIPLEMAKRICEEYPGMSPVLHPGVELHATLEPDGNEVLIGDVCLVLAEVRQEGKVGAYVLAAFSDEDDPSIRKLRFPIGPSMHITPETLEPDYADGVSDSIINPCMYRLTSGGKSWLLGFSAPSTARKFLCDFRVRSRLMKLALKVARLTKEKKELTSRATAGSVCNWIFVLLPSIVAVGASAMMVR